MEVARELFTSQGFSRTTVAEVAASAEVSPEMIYKSFGGKAGLVRAIWESALAGVGPEHAERRADAVAASAAAAAR